MRQADSCAAKWALLPPVRRGLRPLLRALRPPRDPRRFTSALGEADAFDAAAPALPGRAWGWVGRWALDAPELLADEMLARHGAMVRELRGLPGARPERLAEAARVADGIGQLRV